MLARIVWPRNRTALSPRTARPNPRIQHRRPLSRPHPFPRPTLSSPAEAHFSPADPSRPRRKRKPRLKETLKRRTLRPRGVPLQPGWTFSEDVRVVDDSSALTPRESTSTPQPSLPPRYSHVLDPKLADTIDQGPAQETGPQTPSSSVRRNVTIRPSVTGQIPVFRRRPEDS